MHDRTVKLVLEYDGTEFSGWQVQPGERTVQGVLEAALAGLCGVPVEATAAGRTDAGVHALGQVAHARIAVALGAGRVAAALNARLPRDVRVRSVADAPDGFHARFDATSRSYLYLMGMQESPIWRLRRWHLRGAVDRDAMERAVPAFRGERDFGSFALAGGSAAHDRCDIRRMSLEWEPRFGGMLVLRVEANRFLRGMVRSIVGTLAEVGRGRVAPEEIPAIIEARDRGRAGPTAPPWGLYLESVAYGEEG